MFGNHRLSCPRSVLLVLLVLDSTACASSLSLAEYNVIFAGQPVAIEGFGKDQSLLIYPNGAPCNVLLTPGEAFPVATDAMVPLVEQDFAKRNSQVQIHEIAVATTTPPSLGLQIELPDKSSRWLVLRGEGPFGCLVRSDLSFQSRVALIGKFYEFTPWRPECTQITALGPGAAGILVESENPGALQVNGVELGDDSGVFRTNAGMVPWIRFLDGKLRVRSDTLDTCFTASDNNSEQRALAVTSILRVPSGYCRTTDDQGAQHLDCRSTLGVWEGRVDNTGVDLALMQRTLGSVHFRNRRPVNGARYARSIVAVTTDKPATPQVAALYDTIQGAINAVTDKSDGSVRLVRGNVLGATHRLFITVESLTFGEVQRHEEPVTSRFIARYETRDNPAKDEARRAMDRAETELRNAKNRYDSAKEQARRTYDECVEAADKTKKLNHNDGWAGLLIDTAIDIGGGIGCAALTDPSEDELNAARQQRNETRATYDGTSSTIEVPIEEDWKHTKHIATRAADGAVNITITPEGGQPTNTRIPLAFTWKDYEIADDPKHNVKGHPMDQGPINSTDALIPLIARELATHVQTQINTFLAAANYDAAKAEFARTGAGEVTAGYETVDIAAYDTVGPRFIKPLRRGRSPVTTARPATITAGEAQIASDQCLLVVTASEDNRPLKLNLTTADKRVADQRGQASAMVEFCPSRGQNHQELVVSSDVEGAVRWGVYLTRATAANTVRTTAPSPSQKPQ